MIVLSGMNAIPVSREERCMPECWARELGGCSTKLSREHLVSESLWLGKQLRVKGFPWCKNEWRDISLSSFTSKILCQAHNTELSPVDVAGRDLFDALRRALQVQAEREANPARKWPFKQRQVEGPMVERWFLKTTINLVLNLGGDVQWAGAETHGTPPLFLIQAAFGRVKLVSPMGLYTPSEVGENIFDSESVHFAPALSADGVVVAGLFAFRGLNFMMYFGDEYLPRRLALPKVEMPGWRATRPNYRVGQYLWKVGGKPSHQIQVLWPPAFDR